MVQQYRHNSIGTIVLIQQQRYNNLGTAVYNSIGASNNIEQHRPGDHSLMVHRSGPHPWLHRAVPVHHQSIPRPSVQRRRTDGPVDLAVMQQSGGVAAFAAFVSAVFGGQAQVLLEKRRVQCAGGSGGKADLGKPGKQRKQRKQRKQQVGSLESVCGQV